MNLSTYIGLIGPLGTQELVIILAILLLLFGGKKIPQLAKGVARSLVEFKKGKNEYLGESGETEKLNDRT